MHDDAPLRTPTPSIGGRAASGAPKFAPIAPERRPQRVVFVLYDGFQPLDLAGPWQAFSAANEESGQALYQLRTIAATPVVTTWEQGLRMQVDNTFESDDDAPIDMGLKVVAALCGEDVAKLIQLQIEYDPKPPFPGGTPTTSEPAIVERYLAMSQARFERRSAVVDRAAAAMPQDPTR